MSPMAEKNPHQQGRLRSRPVPTPVRKAPVGLQVLRSDDGPAESYLYLPAGRRAEDASPLVLLLHGAGEDARDGLAQLRGQADETGGSRSTAAAAGSFPGYCTPATRYATASSKAATWSRPRSLGRRRPGSPTGAEDVPTYRPRATESLDVGHTPLKKASSLLLRSGAR